MSITGSLVIYVIIWWIVFFSLLPLDVSREKKQNIRGVPSLTETYKFLDENIKKNPNTSHVKPIKIGPDDTFDFINRKIQLLIQKNL